MSTVLNVTVMSSQAGNKTIVPDKDGYYKVILGAFNVKNSVGEVYMFNGVREYFANKDNILNRRLLSGRLKAEADHPSREPGMSASELFMRMLEIKTQSSCGHIKEIKMIETSKSEGIPGVGKIVLVEGLIKPTGPYGEGLKASLDNPDEDTCFSIRCVTNKKRVNGILFKYIKQIITWDWVTEPGIRFATKLGNISTESHDIASIDIDNIAELDNGVFSSESSDVVDSVKELKLLTNQNTDIVNSWI